MSAKNQLEDNSDERLTAVEINLVYMEDFVNKLQSIVTMQSKTIESLKAESRILRLKLAEMLDNQEQVMPHNRPPHY